MDDEVPTPNLFNVDVKLRPRNMAETEATTQEPKMTEPTQDLDFQKLESHFNWKPDREIAESCEEVYIESLLQDIEENPDIKLQGLMLMSYLYTKWQSPDLLLARTTIDNALLKCEEALVENPEMALGLKIVALGNLVHIMRLQEESVESIRKIFMDIHKLNEEATHAKTGAAIVGNKAYSLSRFGPPVQNESMQSYQAALKLDPTDFQWPLGVALLGGRCRRREEGSQTQATEMEESLLRKSIELSEGKKAVPIALLADALLTKGRSFRYSGVNDEDKETLVEANKLFKQALVLAPHSVSVLKRCGKAFAIMREEQLGESCLLHALEVCPRDSMVLQRLGHFYETSMRKKDLVKAEKYYKEAIDSWTYRNLYAEFDLCRVRHKMDKKYDSVKHFEDMKQHYQSSPKYMERIEKAIELYCSKSKIDRQIQDKRFTKKGGDTFSPRYTVDSNHRCERGRPNFRPNYYKNNSEDRNTCCAYPAPGARQYQPQSGIQNFPLKNVNSSIERQHTQRGRGNLNNYKRYQPAKYTNPSIDKNQNRSEEAGSSNPKSETSLPVKGSGHQNPIETGKNTNIDYSLVQNSRPNRETGKYVTPKYAKPNRIESGHQQNQHDPTPTFKNIPGGRNRNESKDEYTSDDGKKSRNRINSSQSPATTSNNNAGSVKPVDGNKVAVTYTRPALDIPPELDLLIRKMNAKKTIDNRKN